MKRSWAIRISGTAVLLLLIGAAAWFSIGATKPKSQFKTGAVERHDLVQRVTIAGTVISRRRTVVAAPYNGYVKQLFVKVGDRVKPGQPLVSVVQSLATSEPVFPLRAPYEGTVMHVNKHEGEYVKEGDAVDYILRLDDLSQLYVQSNAPEMDWAKLKVGLEGDVKASAVTTRAYKGKIDELTLAPQSSQNGSSAGEYPVRIEILDPDGKLGPGMSTVVDITTAPVEGLTAQALESEGGLLFTTKEMLRKKLVRMATTERLRMTLGDNLKRYLDQIVSWELVAREYDEAYRLAREATLTGKKTEFPPEF